MTETPPLPDPGGDLVARALRDLTRELPPGEEEPSGAESSPKLQPWAETASPVAKNKRPLEALLAEYAERIAAHPDAVVVPPSPSPQAAFFDRFGRGGQSGGEGGGSRRRRRRPGRGGGGRRRGRGGRGGGGSGGASSGA